VGGFLAKEISGVKYMHVRPQHVEVLTDREGPKGDEFLLGPVEQGLEHERVDDEKIDDVPPRPASAREQPPS
jgi:hypothetical protein